MSLSPMKRHENATRQMMRPRTHLAALSDDVCSSLQPLKCSIGLQLESHLPLAELVTAFPQKQALKVLQNAVIQKEVSKTKRVTYGLLEHALVAIMRFIRVR